MQKFKTIITDIILAAALIAGTFFATQSCETRSEKENFQESEVYSGMYFNSIYVVETYIYDDVFYIVYDDVDAGINNAKISVDFYTYTMCNNASEFGAHFYGSLELADDCRTYTWIP